jgi:hypothetical protein
MGQGIQPPPVEQGGGAVAAILDWFNVVVDPTAVFNRIKQKPSILYPWLLISAFVLVTTILTQPYNDAAMAALRSSLPPEQAARMGGGGSSPFRLLGVPVITILFAAAGAGLLWLGVLISAASGRFKTLLSVLLHANITFVMFSAISVVVLMLRGVGAISGLADVRPPLGLDLLAPNASLFLGQVLNGINPFSIWGVWLCGTGVSITHGISKGTAITVSAVAYLLGLLLISVPLLLVPG